MTNWYNLACTALALAAAPALAADIVITDPGVFPENITSSARTGTVWMGNVASGGIYRAAPKSGIAQLWIKPGTAGMNQAMGLWADDRAGLLWVCVPGDRATPTQPAGPTAIKSFDLKTGAFRTSHGFAGGSRCNDLTIARDGTLYATDFDGGRIMRLAKGDTDFQPWTSDLAPGVDGIAQLADGHIYVNNYKTGTLTRLPVKPDGSAGAPVAITADRAFGKPDGMRAVGKDRLLMAEGDGRLVEVQIVGDTAKIRLLRDGLTDSPAGVTLVDGTAYVAQARWAAMRDPAKAAEPAGAVAVPYAPIN